MRKYLSFGAAIAFLGTAGSALAQQIQVIVHGSPVNFVGQQPAMINDRLLVPLRGVLERMGARVDWDPSTQTVSARRGSSFVKLAIGQNTAAVNGHPVNLDVPAQIINGSTMVPLRFVGEALGEEVHWSSATNTVTISGGGDYNIPPPAQPVANRAPIVCPQNTVIPVSFDVAFSSDNCHRGQRFDTVVNHYPGIPDGCHVEGVVVDVSPQFGVELNFDTLIGPAGHRYPIHGRACALQGPGVVQRPNGRIIATGAAKNNRFIFANRAEGPGLVSVATHAPINDPRVVREMQNHGAVGQAVQIPKGTQIGIRLDIGIQIK